MPRKPRFYLPGIPAHVVQRGHSREAVFYEDADYNAYLGWLIEAAGRYHCAIHAYVLMTNHVHILVTPSDGEGISRMMHMLAGVMCLTSTTTMPLESYADEEAVKREKSEDNVKCKA